MTCAECPYALLCLGGAARTMCYSCQRCILMIDVNTFVLLECPEEQKQHLGLAQSCAACDRTSYTKRLHRWIDLTKPCLECRWVKTFRPREDEIARGLTLGCTKAGYEGYTDPTEPECDGVFFEKRRP
jgi:hypothetical protein